MIVQIGDWFFKYRNIAFPAMLLALFTGLPPTPFMGSPVIDAWLDMLGLLLALVYAVASVAQVVVGHLINRFALKRFFMFMVMAQIPMLVLASQAQGWWLFAALIGVMVFIFGAIPFTDFMIARYVDDRLRSRVSGMRLGVSFAVSSLSVWALGPVVKAMGFGSSLLLLAGFSVATTLILTLLPSAAHEHPTPA